MKHFKTVLLPIRLAKSKKTIPSVFQSKRNLKYWEMAHLEMHVIK